MLHSGLVSLNSVAKQSQVKANESSADRIGLSGKSITLPIVKASGAPVYPYIYAIETKMPRISRGRRVQVNTQKRRTSIHWQNAALERKTNQIDLRIQFQFTHHIGAMRLRRAWADR